jgi:serine/threonine protein kinase
MRRARVAPSAFTIAARIIASAIVGLWFEKYVLDHFYCEPSIEMYTRKRVTETYNKTRKIGGRLLGEGITGKTYNTGCTVAGGNSFCREIEGHEKYTKKIILFTPDTAPVFLTNKEEIHSFIQYVHSLKQKITKVLKPPHKSLKKSMKTLFHDELDANRKIIKLYGSKADNYLTIAPIVYNSINIIGAQVLLSSRSPLFVIFGTKCNNRFHLNTEEKLKKWTTDILESVEILQKKEFMHNDIKPDNSVLCDTKYKLIDWGFACPMDYHTFIKTDGDDMFISPIRWYINGIPKEIAVQKLKSKTERKNKKLFHSQLWKEFMNFFEDELNYAFHLGLSHQQLFTKYKKSLDIVMVGLTILEAVHDYRLSWNYWKPIVETFVSHKDPCSATKAIHFVDRIF